MGRIVLIRHAQASFFEQDYDKLSALGEEQARLLGRYWARQKTRFDRVYSGPRIRHRETARFVGAAYRDAGLAFPEPVELQEFDEYPGDEVLERSLPELLENDGEIRELHRAFQGSSSAAERERSFQKLFEAVIRQWVDGRISVPRVESWPEFCSRVNRGLSRITSNGQRGERVAVFSSTGPIGVAAQRALHLSPQDTLRMIWMSRNSSFSEFLYSGDRFSLHAFNATPHFEGETRLT